MTGAAGANLAERITYQPDANSAVPPGNTRR
jgi:hypothetical protein